MPNDRTAARKNGTGQVPALTTSTIDQLFQKKQGKRPFRYLADVAERRLRRLRRRGRRRRRGVEEGEAAVLPGELVGAVDAAVARVAQRGLVGAAEDGGRLGRAHVALHLHAGRRLAS